MHHTKPKSAPPRVRSKYVKNRTNAMKEIESWISKAGESFPVPETSRMSGQLADNVTEERMLKSKLWELSKERYKFISQNSYEKKLFQDRQQKKSGLRRVVSASADGRQRHRDVPPVRGRATSLSLCPRDRQKSGVKNARFALLDRLDPTKKKVKQKPHQVEDRDNDSVLVTQPNHIKVVDVKTETKSLPSQPGDRTNTEQGDSSTICGDDTQVNQTPGNKLTNDTSKDHTKLVNSVQLKKSVNSVQSKVRLKPNVNPSGQSNEKRCAAESKDSWASSCKNKECCFNSSKTRKQYGMPVDTRTTDPRFEGLEKTLNPAPRCRSAVQVSDIVDNIQSLHVRPRRRVGLPEKPRSKIEVKAYEYMKERGFALLEH